MTKPLIAPLALAAAVFTAGCATLVPATPTADMGIADMRIIAVPGRSIRTGQRVRFV